MSRFNRNKPKPLKDLLKKFLEQYPHKEPLKRGMVLSVWPETVGEAIAEQTEKLHFKDGRLIIHVRDPAWRHEIHMQRYQLKNKLNSEVGDDVIKEIVVRS